MELRHIRYFLAIASEGSFTRAAEQLGIAQPPLSQQIKLLEQEIGVRLFRRLAHGAELTPAGQAFRTAVSHIPHQVSEGVRLARRAAAGETGILRIGVTGTAALNPLVPACIRAYRNKYPDVELQVMEANALLLTPALLEDRLDVALLRPSQSDPEALYEEVLADEPLLVALPVSHPLARRGTMIDLPELRDDPFILTPRSIGTSLHDASIKACENAGFTPRLGPAAPHIVSILSLVAAELGVSLVPESVAQVKMQNIVLLPSSGPPPRLSISLAYRRGTTSPVVKNFVVAARTAARETQGLPLPQGE
ncbi:LysR family transcriptional regulator [Agrobacterium tumefaciens]|uniref:LysR family transcriptional regulator n=1 Tax=Agrobacterium tumefaciens TaxID=358 RepID=UPI0021CF421D|nr:LysR family transcriptional regulator [Agrobacterium tumefaciens]UXT50968.1 LysR family transcriptional regulator [Agrobacterium tumefaciens]